MSEINELYQEMILEHNRKPRNFSVMDEATCESEGFNPLCGDRITVYLKIQGDVIEDISFQGSGCAISTASASMLTGSLKGKTKSEAESVFEAFHKLVNGKSLDESEIQRIGKMTVFSGVSEYPTRVKCATLAWHTLRAGLSGSEKPVSTE